MSGSDSAPVVVARFHYRHEGEIALGFLESAGIEAALFMDDAGGAEPNLAFVTSGRLMVRAEDVDEAVRILQEGGVETVETE